MKCFGRGTPSQIFTEKCSLELPEVSFARNFGSLGRLVGDFGQQYVTILQRSSAHEDPLMISCDFVRPQELAGGIRPALLGPR